MANIDNRARVLQVESIYILFTVHDLRGGKIRTGRQPCDCRYLRTCDQAYSHSQWKRLLTSSVKDRNR